MRVVSLKMNSNVLPTKNTNSHYLLLNTTKIPLSNGKISLIFFCDGSLNVDTSVLAHAIYTFYINTIKKTARPGRHKPTGFFNHLNSMRNLKINCLKKYRSHTDLLRENLEETPQQLILSYAYPHKAVNSQTIARYVKLSLGMCGIDITIFTAHSTRSASISTANNMGWSIMDTEKRVSTDQYCVLQKINLWHSNHI